MNLVEGNRIMKPSIVGTVKATSHYLQQPINWLTIFPTASYLAGRLLPYAGLNVPAWVTKVSDTAVECFMIYELGAVLSSPVSLAKDAKVAYDVLWGGKSPATARLDQKGDFPRDDNAMKIGPRVWITYRLSATTFKFASSGLAVYTWLKSDATVHPWLKVLGPALGASAYLIDIADRERRIRDHATSSEAEYAMIKPRKKTELDDSIDETYLANDKCLLSKILSTHWRGSQMISGTFFTMRVVVIMLALKELVKSESLVGRACQLVETHEDNIWGALFIVTVATTAMQHLRTGATLAELTDRKINKT